MLIAIIHRASSPREGEPTNNKETDGLLTFRTPKKIFYSVLIHVCCRHCMCLAFLYTSQMSIKPWPYHWSYVAAINRSPVDFLHKVSVMQSFGISSVDSLNELFGKQSSCLWFETPWRWCGVTVICRASIKGHGTSRWLSCNLWYPQHNCVRDTIVYH